MATASPSCKAMLTAWLEFVGCHIVQEGDTYYETKQFPASASSPSFASWLLRSVWCQPSTSVHRSTYQVPEYSLSFQADIFWGAPSAHRELGPLFAKLRGDVRAVYAPGEADSPMSKFVASPEHLATFLEEIWRRQKVPDEWTDSKHCILMHNFGFNLLERVLIRRLALYGLYLGINANDNIKRRTPINAVCAIRLKMTTNPGGHHMAMIARLSDLGVPVGFVTIVRSFFKTIAPEKDPPQLSAFLFDWAVELLMAKSGVTASARWQIGFRDYVLVHDSIDELHFAVEELRRNSAEYGVRIGTAQSLVVRKRGLPKLDVDGLREVEGFGGLSDFVGIKRDVAEMPPLLGCHDFWGCGENSTLERCGAIPFNSDVFLAVEWFDVLVGRLRPFGYEDCKTELRILIASVRFSEEESDQENMKKSGRRRPALFPIEMWSVYARTKDGTVRTNNYSEAAHRRIQAEFQMQHPTIWKFIDALRQVQASRDTAYEAMVRGDPPPKKRKLYQLIDERLLRIITNFDESEPDGNIEEFLRGCAHNFQMDPKKEAMEYETQLEICVSAAMNQIKNLSYGELKDLHENDAKIDAIIESLPQIRSLPNEKDMVLAQNKSFAECNLTLEPKLNEAKVELMANYEEAMKYKAEVETLKARLDAVSSKRSIDATCACLQAAVREAEDESEKLMEDLQMGKIEPDRFVDEFVRKKTLAHKRKIKSEKLMAIVNEQQMVMERRSSTRSVPYPDVMMNRNLIQPLNRISSRQFATLREQARKVDPRYIYEPEFKDPRIYPTLPTLNVRLQSYDYVQLELYQSYVDKVATRFNFDVVESYAVAAKTERCVSYKPNSTVVDSEVDLSIYDRVVRLENVYAVHLPLFISLLRTHLPVGVKMTVKEHEKDDESYRYIPDLLLKQRQEELKALDDPVVRRNLGWE